MFPHLKRPFRSGYIDTLSSTPGGQLSNAVFGAVPECSRKPFLWVFCFGLAFGGKIAFVERGNFFCLIDLEGQTKTGPKDHSCGWVQMTTARTKLHAELTALLQNPVARDLDAEILRLLSGFRLQYKNNPTGSAASLTARQALSDRLKKLATERSKDVMGAVAEALDDYRMQRKPGGKKAPRPAKAKLDPAVRAVQRKEAAQGASRVGASGEDPGSASGPNAVGARPSSGKAVKRTKRAPEPVVARAAARKGVTRSECPKCHSMGVVLARSYAEDEYYSCIYCGWQGFKAAIPGQEQDNLAARLLGIYNTSPDDDGNID